MIVFLTTPDGQHTIETYLAGGGASLRDLIAAWTYPELERRFRRGPLPSGTYVFADIERLDAAGEARAAEVWRSLQRDPGRWRTLNQPLRTMRRLPLLEALYRAGINDFRAWPALGPAPVHIRFPVFLRVADDHDGARTDLLADASALTRELATLRATVPDLHRWIVCEHAALPRPDGSHAKHGAFNIAGDIIPRHVMFGPGWVVKTSRILTPATFHEQWVYLAENPHAELLARIFAIAGADYGRIDYLAMPDGRIRVWEINTNPDPYPLALALVGARASFDAAWHMRTERSLRALDAKIPSGPASPALWQRIRWRVLRARVPAFGATAIERGLWSILTPSVRFGLQGYRRARHLSRLLRRKEAA